MLPGRCKLGHESSRREHQGGTGTRLSPHSSSPKVHGNQGQLAVAPDASTWHCSVGIVNIPLLEWERHEI